MEINLSFGAYTHPLKSLFKEGCLSTVTKGLYGENITRKNVSIEHLVPHSRTGRTTLGGIALASMRRNKSRGNKQLWKVDNIIETAKAYIDQFDGINIPGKFDGALYKRLFIRQLRDLGIDLDLGFIFRNKPKTVRKPLTFLSQK